ncbi:MAG TPA: 2'-5' RNA ligase family protein [Chitinophagaceae bacterium]|nr:2'-5' RNA ligase family protein [Chitinophagaceae bacterium]
MEMNVNQLPGCRVYDYILVINPHEELSNKIADIRKEFNRAYQVTGGQVAKTNLHLVSFSQIEMKEERIKNRLKTIAMGHPPFKVELRDFGSFPSHTIHMNVVSKIPIQTLVKTIRTEAQSLMKFDDENKPYFNLEPHITIASKLKPWQYEKGWLEYSNKHYMGRFIADAMLLLKKQKEDKTWQIVQRFEFQNLPVHVKQGDLFG